MTFKTHYEPVPVIEAGEVIYQIEGDDLQSIYLRPRPDTVLLTREEVEEVKATYEQPDLNKLLEWTQDLLLNGRTKQANTHFTAGVARDIATTIESLLNR